jgi:4-methyl-5(b-hydroxyethyl)-thiazole monophosphate biosynthesis
MVYIHLAHGFEEIEAVTILDILRRGNVSAGFVAIGPDKRVMGAHNITVEADLLFEEANYETCEMILLPGGMPGTKNLASHGELVEKIKEFNLKGKLLGAICAAPMVFGQAGILDGRKATIYPGMEASISKAKHSMDRVVRDGNIITSRGPGTAMEFGLVVLEALQGKNVAEELRKDLVL